jgi:glycine oxidase
VADVVVVGGGVIGLAVAWKAAAGGAAVTVCDPEPGMGASWAAAGMLAPVTESRLGEPALTELCVASLRAWPDFARELEGFSGSPVGLRTEGTLAVAGDDADRRALDRLADVHRQLGLASYPLDGSECRDREPLLGPRVAAGLDVPGDYQVDNRVLVVALREACSQAGVEVLNRRVRAVKAAHHRVSAVATEEGEEIEARLVVLAAGCWSGQVGLPADVSPLPVRPVKGQIMRLRAEPHLLPGRTVRGLVGGVSVYVVPRESGQVVVGGTVEERGFDTTVTAGAVLGMLKVATEVVPAVGEMVVEDAIARLRPGTPDDGPVIGPAPLEGLFYATGHHRNGILMAPLTASLLVAAMSGQPLPPPAAPFGWQRFAS